MSQALYELEGGKLLIVGKRAGALSAEILATMNLATEEAIVIDRALLSDLVQMDISQADVPSGHQKITQAELIEIFGANIPMEAAKLLWNRPSEMSMDDLRARLREIAASGHQDFEAKARALLDGREYGTEHVRVSRVSCGGFDNLVADIASALSEAYEAGRLVQTHAEPALPPSGHPGCNICGAPLHMGCCNPARPANRRYTAGAASAAAQVTAPLPQGDLVQTLSSQAQTSSGHPYPEGSELCDPLDALTWRLVHAFGAAVNTGQWLAARKLLETTNLHKEARQEAFDEGRAHERLHRGAQVTAPKSQGEFETSQEPRTAPEAPKATDAPDNLASPATSPDFNS